MRRVSWGQSVRTTTRDADECLDSKFFLGDVSKCFYYMHASICFGKWCIWLAADKAGFSRIAHGLLIRNFYCPAWLQQESRRFRPLQNV